MDLPATLPPDLSPYTFVVGRWERGRDAQEWVAVGDVLVGLILHGSRGWEVSVIRGAQGPHPGGERVEWVTFTPAGLGPSVGISAPSAGSLAFPSVDGPVVGLRADGEGGLVSTATGRPRRWRRAGPEPAAALEQADRAFHEAVVAGGLESWVAAFDPEVGFQLDGARAVPAGPGTAELVGALLSTGRLDWEPVASGSDRGVGWTVGTYTWTAGDGESSSGSYVTVWRRQPDGTWKVWFDTGDPVGPGE